MTEDESSGDVVISTDLVKVIRETAIGKLSITLTKYIVRASLKYVKGLGKCTGNDNKKGDTKNFRKDRHVIQAP